MKAVAKSGRVLHAFSEFYLPFYGLETAFLFKHFDVFGCISAAVYCIDESIEADCLDARSPRVSDLQRLLSHRMYVDDRVLVLLEQAREYCAFEVTARSGAVVMDMPQILRATEIRSVDFRLMHHALLQRARITYDEDVFEWFRSFEMLMEIEDDLSSVDEDEQKGTYNYYCFVRRLVPASVNSLVESAVTNLEQRLNEQASALRESGRARCEDVVRGTAGSFRGDRCLRIRVTWRSEPNAARGYS